LSPLLLILILFNIQLEIQNESTDIAERWSELCCSIHSNNELFALWGFANDITNPMVKAFSKIFRMSVTDGALVQVGILRRLFRNGFPCSHVHTEIQL
jgi:hypothetical protein